MIGKNYCKVTQLCKEKKKEWKNVVMYVTRDV